MFYLFIDDIRNPDHPDAIANGVDPSLPWKIARTPLEAISLVEAYGMPTHLALDHDLGLDQNGNVMEVPKFLKWLAYEYWTDEPIPEYVCHTSNTVGRNNMVAFMESWKKSLTL